MKIRSKRIESKIEYHRKRNKCPCCTRDNYKAELVRRAEIKEATVDVEFSVADSTPGCDPV